MTNQVLTFKHKQKLFVFMRKKNTKSNPDLDHLSLQRKMTLTNFQPSQILIDRNKKIQVISGAEEE